MRIPTRPRRGARAALTLGLLAAAGLAITGAAASGHAGSAPATTTATTTAAAVSPAPDAPISGLNVAGAVYGASAQAAAGSLAQDFSRSHQSMLKAVASGPADSTAAAASQLHDWWGSFPNTGSGPGGMATQSIDPNFRLTKAGDVLYAPTMKPANGSCIEVVTVHSTGVPQIWAWDWCNKIAPGAEVNVTSTFMAKYTTTVDGRSAYTQMNKLTDKATNTWTSYLYDYPTKAWDKLFSSSGTDKSGLSYGWDMFEFYSATDASTGHTYVCDDLAKAGLVVQSSSLQIENSSGTWTSATASDSKWMPEAAPNPATYKCPSMVFTIVTDNNDWTVNVG